MIQIIPTLILYLFRTATRLVLAASMTFLILMLPRGISYLVKIFTPQVSAAESRPTDVHLIVDEVLSWLQYLNHSINFFIYVLASKRFRFSS